MKSNLSLKVLQAILIIGGLIILNTLLDASIQLATILP